MKNIALVTVGLLLAALAGIAMAQQPSEDAILSARIARIENGLIPGVIVKGEPAPLMKLSDRMKHYHVPGISVAFIDHGAIAWTRTYGYADVASKTRVTPDTLFQAASISKPVAAMAAMRLVQDGKLKLDEDVNLKLATWKVPENSFTVEQKVTLRRLLSHTAGLTTSGFEGYVPGEPLPDMVQILNGDKPANSGPVRVDAVPGSIWRYSGGGYVVMRALLSEVTHEDFLQLVSDLVLRPAGMTHSTFQQPLPKSLQPNAATGYQIDGQPLQERFCTMPELAPDGLWSTPTDLARFAIEVLKEYAGTSDRIVSPATVREMLTRQKENYGLGFEMEPQGSEPWFGHGGSNRGFRSRLLVYPKRDQGIVIMTNGDGGRTLREEFIRAVAKEYGWPNTYQQREHSISKIDSQTLRTYAGVYEYAKNQEIHLRIKNNALYLDMIPLGFWQEQLFPESETQFFLLSEDIVLKFKKANAATSINS